MTLNEANALLADNTLPTADVLGFQDRANEVQIIDDGELGFSINDEKGNRRCYFNLLGEKLLLRFLASKYSFDLVKRRPV